MPSNADLIADEEEFHSSFRIYLNALAMLASSAEKQCELMGDFNVAWELKQDVQNGKFLVNRGHLPGEEEHWISTLSAALESVNTQVLPAGGGREANMAAMSSACWEPLRYLAAEVQRRLMASAEKNAQFLGLASNAV